jgi:hypothetical protein
MTTGTLTNLDLSKQIFTSAVDYGLDKIYDFINQDLASYNASVREMMAEFCEATQKQTVVFDGSSNMAFEEADEFGVPTSKKDNSRWDVSFPVRKFIAGLGWTQDFLSMKTPAELEVSYTKLKTAHAKNIIKMIKRAIFNNVNYSFVDTHYNAATLTVRRFWNADGSTMPNNSNGTAFDGTTHTHYLASAAVSNADIDGAISTVREHDQTLGVRIYVNGANISDLEAIVTTKFKALSSALLVYSGENSTVAKLDNRDISNYLAGIWDGLYEVWVKPWVPEDYITVLASEMPDKPLAFRELPFASMQGLKLDSMVSVQPLVSQSASHFAGVGVLNRSAGSVLYDLTPV